MKLPKDFINEKDHGNTIDQLLDGPKIYSDDSPEVAQLKGK